MKISDILLNLDLSKKEKYYLNSDFLNEFDIQEYDIDFDKIEDAFTCIRIITWYCTDSWVGNLVILLNDIPICISSQLGRKSDCEFEWISREAYSQAKNLIEKAKIIREKEITLIKLDQEIGNFYKIEFNNQLIKRIHSVAYFKGQKVLVEPIKSNHYLEDRVEILFQNGKAEIVKCGELDFPFSGLKSKNELRNT